MLAMLLGSSLFCRDPVPAHHICTCITVEVHVEKYWHAYVPGIRLQLLLIFQGSLHVLDTRKASYSLISMRSSRSPTTREEARHRMIRAAPPLI